MAVYISFTNRRPKRGCGCLSLLVVLFIISAIIGPFVHKDEPEDAAPQPTEQKQAKKKKKAKKAQKTDRPRNPSALEDAMEDGVRVRLVRRAPVFADVVECRIYIEYLRRKDASGARRHFEGQEQAGKACYMPADMELWQAGSCPLWAELVTDEAVVWYTAIENVEPVSAQALEPAE